MAGVELIGRTAPLRVAAPMLWLAAAGYSTWLLSYVLHVDVSTVDGYVSELPARDQPYHVLFGTGDVVAGVLVVIASLIVLFTVRPERVVTFAWCALAVFGLFTVLDIAFPLDCAPSVSAACRAADDAGTTSTSHQIHSVTSVVAYGGIITHMVLVAWTERRRPGSWPVLGRYALRLAAVMVISTLIVLVLVPVGRWLGIPQRVSVLCVAVWFVLVGCSLLAGQRQGAGAGAAQRHGAEEVAVR